MNYYKEDFTNTSCKKRSRRQKRVSSQPSLLKDIYYNAEVGSITRFISSTCAVFLVKTVNGWRELDDKVTNDD